MILYIACGCRCYKHVINKFKLHKPHTHINTPNCGLIWPTFVIPSFVCKHCTRQWKYHMKMCTDFRCLSVLLYTVWCDVLFVCTRNAVRSRPFRRITRFGSMCIYANSNELQAFALHWHRLILDIFSDYRISAIIFFSSYVFFHFISFSFSFFCLIAGAVMGFRHFGDLCHRVWVDMLKTSYT